MKEQNIAKAYAKSLYQLSLEKGVNIADEMIALNEVIRESNDLENVMFLDVFSKEEKTSVMETVIEKLGQSALLKNFVSFLINEKRMDLFPLIFKELVVIDDHEKGFLRGVIEGSEVQADPEFEKKLNDFLSQKLGKKTQLSYQQSESITAGYKVTVEDLQLDASLDNQLNQFKNTVLQS